MGRSIAQFLSFLNSPRKPSKTQVVVGCEREVGWNRVGIQRVTIALLSLALFCIIHGPSTLWATTIVATSCSQTDVGIAVNSAVNGDTVVIPNGDCTWTTQLNITQGITIQGQTACAIDANGRPTSCPTIIRDNVPKNGSTSSSLMRVTVNLPNTFHLTNMEIDGLATDPNVYNIGHIALTGTSLAVHIDHILHQNPQTSFTRWDGALWGLIDHVMLNGNGSFAQVGHSNWNGGAYGDGSWADTDKMGTQGAVFIEANTLNANNNPYATAAWDALDGARIVFRYNILVQGNSTSHGVDSGQRRRSIRWAEVYNNTYTFPPGMAVAFIHWFRGGSGVMFNNAITNTGGVNNVAAHTNLRDTGSFSPWGQCNGTSVYDQNTAAGWICVDQPGAGQSNNLGGAATPPSQWVGNASSPIYVWNNTINGVSNDCGSYPCANDGNVHVGRDIIYGTPKPGYVPFVYPHPLQTAQTATGTPPPAPTGLSVR